jgi:signal transduction histidine kinase
VKPTDIPKESFDLCETIEETVNAIALNPSISKNMRISFLPSQKKCQIKGNKEKMKQVFWNLFLNAHQAMPKGGDIQIRTTRKEDQIQIEISDSGAGIPEEIINKIFDPFFTTKSKGTGLGLSLVHKIIEAHEGRIFVNSKEGEGTTFTITLPTAV